MESYEVCDILFKESQLIPSQSWWSILFSFYKPPHPENTNTRERENTQDESFKFYCITGMYGVFMNHLSRVCWNTWNNTQLCFRLICLSPEIVSPVPMVPVMPDSYNIIQCSMQVVLFMSRKWFWNLWFYIILSWQYVLQILLFHADRYTNDYVNSQQWWWSAWTFYFSWKYLVPWL